jgi:hypothetical protein
MSVPDALIGRVLLVAITAAFAYATVWLFAVVRVRELSGLGAEQRQRYTPPRPPSPRQRRPPALPPKIPTPKQQQPFFEQGHAVLALFPPSYDPIFLPICLLGTAAAAAALALVGLLYVAEGVGKPLPPRRLRELPPPAAGCSLSSPSFSPQQQQQQQQQKQQADAAPRGEVAPRCHHGDGARR